MQEITQIYSMLNWENSAEIQLKGKQLAANISDLSLLIQPSAAPPVWEHCAEILSEKSDDELAPYLGGLLEWLQDLNLPGAFIIMDRLKVFSGRKLKEPFIKSFNDAKRLNNKEGLRWLNYLSELLANEELKAELPNTIIEALQKYYKIWQDDIE